MQIADSPTREALVAAGRQVLASASASPKGAQPSTPALYAMKFIAESTQISGPDKKMLTRLVAIADELGEKDAAKMFEAIMKLAQLLAAQNEPGTYRAHSMREILDEYWQQRESLRAQEAGGAAAARAEITQAALAHDAPEILLEGGLLEA